ncbi:unnamed protein product [Echinostoma caproni]|uniref:Stork_head domain-containing protein n=1 Tax=Echinostoma caproni TaxID=27848 RepID=A0A183B485_9TREM|nr:unnamed protein product [Echinostoma caproni]
MAMRLEEVICQLLWQNTQIEPSCSIEKLMTCLRNVYRDLQPRPPSYEAVRAALSALVTAGAVYFSGQGYSLLTAEKLAVAKWLENVPEVVSLSEQEEQEKEEEEEEERDDQAGDSTVEPKKAPLAQIEPCSEPYGVCHTDSSPTCNPYASSNVLNLRSDPIMGYNGYLESPTMQLSNPAVLSSMPSLEFPSSLELQARRNRPTRDKSETWNPTLHVSPPVRHRDASIPAGGLSQPTISAPMQTERHRSFPMHNLSQPSRPVNYVKADWSSSNPVVSGATYPTKDPLPSSKSKGMFLLCFFASYLIIILGSKC